MKTGFSLCSCSHKEKPVFITGVPANEKIFPCVGKLQRENGIAVQPIRPISTQIGLDPLSYLHIMQITN